MPTRKCARNIYGVGARVSHRNGSYRLRTPQSRELQFGAHTLGIKTRYGKRKKRKQRGIKGRFYADGFLHPFVSMFSRRTIALHGAAFAADAFPDCARTPSICAGRRFSSATGITRKLHPLFSQGAKDHPMKIHAVSRVNPLTDFVVLSRTQHRVIYSQGLHALTFFYHIGIIKHSRDRSAWRILVTSVAVLTGILPLTRIAYMCNAWPSQITLGVLARTRRKIATVTRARCTLKYAPEAFLTAKQGQNNVYRRHRIILVYLNCHMNIWTKSEIFIIKQ